MQPSSQEQTIPFYAQFLHNYQHLANGHQLIKQYLSHQNNRSNTLLHLLHPQVPVLILVSNVYGTEIYPEVHEDEKHETRKFLLQLLAKTIIQEGLQKNIQNLFLFVDKLHNQEGYEGWVQLYIYFIQFLQDSKVSAEVIAQVLIRILKNADSRISCLSKHLLQYSIKNFSNFTLSTIMEVLYYCVKSLSHLVGTDEETINEYFLPYSTNIVTFAWQNVKADINTMKYSLKLLTVFFSDMQPQQSQINSQISREIPNLLMDICSQYIASLQKGSQFSNLDDLQEGGQENQANLNAVFYQALQLTDSIMENYQQKLNVSPILFSSILGTVVDQKQYMRWIKHSQEYFLAMEDEGSTNLRNRCIQMIQNLIESENKGLKQFLSEYLIHIFSNVEKNEEVSFIQEFFKKKNIHSLQLKGTFKQFQESCYFIVSSFFDELFNEAQKSDFIQYLFRRANASNCPVIIVGCLMILVARNNLKPEVKKHMLTFLLGVAEKNVNSLGILLSVCKGLGKCSYSQQLFLDKDIPSKFIAILLDSVLLQPQLDPDCDATHTILELIYRLCEKDENIEPLKQILDKKIQKHLLTNYMHDGMLATIIVKVIGKIAHQQIIEEVFQLLVGGQANDERYSDLFISWIQNKLVRLSVEHILILLRNYPQKKRYIISKLVKFWLQCYDGIGIEESIREQLMKQLNNSPDESWFLQMMKNNLMVNIEKLIEETLKKLTFDITSPYQFQSKLTLPYYMGVYHTKDFLEFVNSLQIYQQFMEKLFKYAQLFKGDHLKIITSIFLLKIASFDLSLKQKVISVIEGYESIVAEEWEDEEEEIDENAIMQKLLGNRIINEELEKQFQSVFKELAWAHSDVKEQLQKLKL